MVRAIPRWRQSAVLLIAILGLFVGAAESLHARSSAEDPQRGILWRIERPSTKPSYILGTIHSDDSRVTHLPKIISQTLRQADSFVAELKMDGFSMQELGQLMLLPAGQELESLIGTARYQTCQNLLSRYGVSADMVQRMKPWAVMVTLSMPRLRTGRVLDHQLYQEAKLQGKRLYGLETNREQVAVFEAFNLKQQILMLDDAIKDVDRLPMIFDELIHYYLQRDLTALQQISEKYMAHGDSAITNHFKQKALLERNYRMVDRMQARLLEGNSFIAVGALHLPGKEGILRLLEKEGYKITAVY